MEEKVFPVSYIYIYICEPRFESTRKVLGGGMHSYCLYYDVILTPLWRVLMLQTSLGSTLPIWFVLRCSQKVGMSCRIGNTRGAWVGCTCVRLMPDVSLRFETLLPTGGWNNSIENFRLEDFLILHRTSPHPPRNFSWKSRNTYDVLRLWVHWPIAHRQTIRYDLHNVTHYPLLSDWLRTKNKWWRSCPALAFHTGLTWRVSH